MTNRIFYAALALMALVIFTWPIPGTIALRHSLLGALLLVVLMSTWQTRQLRSMSLTRLRVPVLYFAALTLWIILVIVGWSAESSLSWKEFWGQWALPVVCGALGWLIAQTALKRGEREVQCLLKTIFLTMFVQVLLHDAMGLAYLIATGTQPFRQAPVLYLPNMLQVFLSGGIWTEVFTGLYFEKFSFVNNTFAAILIAEALQRSVQHKRWLPFSNLVIGIAFVAVILCSYWLRVRNGNIGLVFLIVVAGVMTLVRVRHRFKTRNLLMVFVVAIVALMGVGAAFWKSDARWQTFAETVPLALDTEKNKAWLSTTISPYPRLANGAEVDPSNYERLAWIKEGLKLGWENPLGTGINRNAFFDGLDRKYQMNGEIRGGHAHSGVVDFFIANGLPGLLLWFAFLFSLTLLGWRAFAGANMALGLMLIFLISGFFSRSFLDSNIRDHVLQQFLFMATIFATLCAASMPGKCASDSKT